MKNLKQLVLPCYKMEVAMNVEAWYFLHGTTNGVCNLTYFLSLLSGMAVTEVSKSKRGLGYVLHPGQVDGSMLSLAKEWNIGRKSVCRLLEDFSQRGLIRVVSNPITTIMDMVCVKSWMMDGRFTENPTYQQTVKAYEGVRIYLFNGQRLETLRKSSAKAKSPRTNQPRQRSQVCSYQRTRNRQQNRSAQRKVLPVRQWLMPTMPTHKRMTFFQQYRTRIFFPMAIPLINRRKQGRS